MTILHCIFTQLSVAVLQNKTEYYRRGVLTNVQPSAHVGFLFCPWHHLQWLIFSHIQESLDCYESVDRGGPIPKSSQMFIILSDYDVTICELLFYDVKRNYLAHGNSVIVTD